jgi:ribosome-associated toxin RatA of RatAB toxin-antitoxin module
VTLISRSALVPYTPEEMFALVSDIESYPAFLPWCRHAEIHSQNDGELHATIEMAKAGVHKAFSTRNRLQPGKLIEMHLLEGPFKRLDGFWRFDRLGDEGCKVSLDMQFEFASKVLGAVVGPVFSQIANSLVDAFQKRAVQVYGKR